MKYADFGSVSSGTLRTDDLLGSFADELEYQLSRQPTRFARKEYRTLLRQAYKAIRIGNDNDKDWLVDELQDKLGEFVPPYSYFGTHIGDGADFGYWLSDEFPDDGFDGVKVDDLSEVDEAIPDKGYRGEVLVVSDHGNMTLYSRSSRGKLTEVWSLV